MNGRAALLFVLAFAASVAAQDLPRYGDALYQPRAAAARQGCDVAADAGADGRADAGDGKDDERRCRLRPGFGRRPAPIAAAQKFGATAVGIEYDRDLAALARRNAERAGVRRQGDDRRRRHLQGRLHPRDRADAYLLPDLNQQLRPGSSRCSPERASFRTLGHGRVGAGHHTALGDGEAFLWIVPARVEGRWALRDSSGFFTGELSLTQRFPAASAVRSHLRGNVQPVLGAYVEGDILGFTFVDLDGGVRSVRARVDGGALAGSLNFAGNLTPLVGHKGT
jgi:hypothetical protein